MAPIHRIVHPAQAVGVHVLLRVGRRRVRVATCGVASSVGARVLVVPLVSLHVPRYL